MSHPRTLAYAALTLDQFRNECRTAFDLQIDAACSADKELALDRQLDLSWSARGDTERIRVFAEEMQAARERLEAKRERARVARAK